MWRRAPRSVEQVLRLTVALTLILFGFGVVRLLLAGQQGTDVRTVSLICIFAHAAIIGGSIWNPMSRLRRRLARSIADRLPEGPKHIVGIHLLRNGKSIGSDTGALALLDGCFRYEGLTTSFAIPRSQIRPEVAGAFKLIADVGDEKVSIALHEEGALGTKSSLAATLAEFWKSPSGGDMVPPPLEKNPRPWSGRFFPGLELIVFWIVVNAALIVQSELLHANGQVAAERVLGLTYFATLAVAFVPALIRLIILCRQTHRELPPLPAPIDRQKTQGPLSEVEPEEPRVRA